MRNNQIFFPHQDNLLELYFQELNSDEIILVINKHYSQFPIKNLTLCFMVCCLAVFKFLRMTLLVSSCCPLFVLVI